MSTKDLTIAVVGSGGDGVVTLGEMVAQAGARVGLHVIKTEAYGPQIRGGESSCTVRLSAEPISAQSDKVDVLVTFNWADFGRFRAEIALKPDAIVFHEQNDKTEATVDVGPQIRLVPVPFVQMSKDTTGGPGAKNILTLGMICELLGLPADALRSALTKKFKKKAAALESNLKGFEAGVELAKTFDPAMREKALDYTASQPKLLMSGNEASAVGAIHAGCRFFAGYPITPSSEILHLLGEWLPKMGGSTLQTEDELAAISAVVGGSFAGVKSMTATSGPGLSLMAETVGLASIAEVPTVIVNVQRGGPSTGIPTKSEQSDLWHAVFASHGDTPRVVLAPADVEDCFHSTVDAFNIAEEFQIPVIVLSDQLIGQRRETLSIESLEHEVVDRRIPTEEELEGYKRYAITPNGVSPMAIPGMVKGMYQTNGLEHTETGAPSAMYTTHEVMNEKRYRKMFAIRDKYHFVRKYGAEKAELGILCWGSSKGPVKEAVQTLNAQGRRVSAFVPQMIYPFPKRELEAWLATVDQLLIVELSYAAQFYRYLRTFMDFKDKRLFVHKRSGGKNLSVSEVEEAVTKVLNPEVVATEVLV